MSVFTKRLLQHLLPCVRVRALVLKELSSPSLPRNLSTPPFQFFHSTHRLLSTATIQAPSPNTHFPIVDYLVQSCGLSSDDALKASKSIQHLKSSDNPDAVLRFLRETGVSNSDITTVVSQHPCILCSNVEKNLRPNVAKLQELGCSLDYISALIARRPRLFLHRFASKIDFWVQAIGSNEFVSVLPIIYQSDSLLGRSLEKVLIPNLYFLKEQCGFSSPQIVRVIKSNPRLISLKPEVLKRQAERAEKLGVVRSSGSFLYALILVSYLNQGTIESRINNMKSLGLSQEEVITIVSKLPFVLCLTEEVMRRKMKFLLNEFGGDKLQLLHNPSLLSCSLDMRIIPRNLVRKLLKSKGIALGDLALTSFMRPSNVKFLGKFIVPYENAIPGLRQAYLEAIARGASAREGDPSSMSMNLFLGRIYCVPISRSATTPLASSNAPTETSPPNLNFATQYLIQSCALSSDEALQASKLIPHLKSPDKPDAVLRFLREIGVTETDIRSAVSKDALLLCCNVEKKWRPNVAKLQELGFSIQDISGIIAYRPRLFRYNLVPKLDFWVQTLGSTEFLSVVLKSGMSLVSSSLEKVLIPNLSFLKDECGFSPLQIVLLIRFRTRSITYRPEVLRSNAERAKQLGVARSSGTFLYALNIVSSLSHDTIESRINNLKSLGLSQEEVTTIVSKFPLVLSHTEEKIARKIEFLINEFGCDNSYLAQNPALLTYSLDKRLIPRNLVRNLLKSKGISVANQPAASFVTPTEKQFLVKFVMPYEHAIPGLQRAYEDACC